MAEYKKGKYRELTANEEDRKIVPEPYEGGHPIRILAHDT